MEIINSKKNIIPPFHLKSTTDDRFFYSIWGNWFEWEIRATERGEGGEMKGFSDNFSVQ